ncbi:MAG: hypothetical protein ACK6BU_06140 [Cyanobacteriota bacterium]
MAPAAVPPVTSHWPPWQRPPATPFTLVPRSKGPWVAETSPALAAGASNRASSEPAATTG